MDQQVNVSMQIPFGMYILDLFYVELHAHIQEPPVNNLKSEMETNNAIMRISMVGFKQEQIIHWK